MGMDLGLARQQLSGKRKKTFEKKLKEKNARKTARRRGIRQRKQLEETKPLLSSNTVFYGILAILLITVVYIAQSPFKSAEDNNRISSESTQAPPAVAQSPENFISPARQTAPSSTTSRVAESGVLPSTTEINDNFFVDVNVVTTQAGNVKDSGYYQLDNTLSSQTIENTGNSANEFGLPTLEIVIQNTSDSAIILSQLIFSDITSTPVITPEILVSPVVNLGDSNDRYIVIENEGWGRLRNTLLQGSLIRNGRNQAIPDIPIGEFDGSAKIDVSALLSDIYDIPAPEQGEEILFSGSLSYDYYSSDDSFVSETREFSCRLINSDTPETIASEDIAILSESEAKRAIFEPEKQNYSVQTRIFQAIKAGEEGRVLVVFGATTSSLHEFELSLTYNGSQTRDLGQYTLNYYLPRSQNRKINELLP